LAKLILQTTQKTITEYHKVFSLNLQLIGQCDVRLCIKQKSFQVVMAIARYVQIQFFFFKVPFLAMILYSTFYP